VDVLRPGGGFVAKVFQGGATGDLLDLLKANFKTVRHYKPPASRSGSAETFVIAQGFRGAADDASD
jgi:23S rRNA (uridine2552-2'-O)-methyltransferase